MRASRNDLHVVYERMHTLSLYRGVPKFWTCTTVYMHALEGLAGARVSLRLARGPPCMQGSALTLPSLPRALRQAFSHMLEVRKI